MRSLSTLKLAAVAAIISTGFASTVGRASEWTDGAGRKFEGEVAAVYGSVVAVSSNTNARLLSLARLSAPELDRVAEFLARQPEQPVKWSTSGSPVAKALHKRLQIRDGTKLVDFDPGERAEPEIYLVYFSAHWCGPCRRFTPLLEEAYHAMKADPQTADLFEVVFVSSDRSAKEQLTYVNEASMPWPVLKYSQVGKARVLERWSGRGIPCLVAVNRAGEVIFHSYSGEQYLGPNEPLKHTRELLAQHSPHLPATRYARHRLAVAQHVYASRGGQQDPRPYVVGLDPEIYRRAGVTSLNLLVNIDEQGRVAGVRSDTELGAVTAERLRKDAATWLFLPRAEDGRAVATKATFPLAF